jgi:hypothetical protein
MGSSTAPADAGSEAPNPRGRKRDGWIWGLVYGLLLLSALALLVFAQMRQPEVIYRTVPGPGPNPRQVERLNQERARTDQLQKEMSDLRTDVAANNCPPRTIKRPDTPPATRSPAGPASSD